MSEIMREKISGGWRSADTNKARFEVALTAAEIDALEARLAATRDTEALATTRQQWEDPAINALMARVREIVVEGLGVVILTGLSRDRFSDEDFERIYWGIGTHLGEGQRQNVQGDLLGYVREEPENPTERGYRSAAELAMHTDTFEIVGLMCVQRAESGGESSLANALGIYNRIVESRPDLLDALYEGYYFWLPEKKVGIATTDRKMPVFCNVGGVVSCNFAGSYMRRAAELRGETLPAKLSEAIDYFAELAASPEFRTEFMLEDGDVLLWNNLTHLHARKAFQNSPERKRYLLRLWLTLKDGRPVTERFSERRDTLARMYNVRAAA